MRNDKEPNGEVPRFFSRFLNRGETENLRKTALSKCGKKSWRAVVRLSEQGLTAGLTLFFLPSKVRIVLE